MQDYEKRRFGFMRHLRYMESSGQYFADLHIVDTSYNSGPFYSTFLESLGIPFDIKVSASRAGGGNPGKMFRSMISERRAEFRLANGLVSGQGSLKNQIADLERMQKQFEKEGSAPFNVTIMLRVYASHPATLNERIGRVVRGLKMLGITAVPSRISSSTAKGLLTAVGRKKAQYLMNSIDLAHIIPVYREAYGKGSGVVIGVDDLTERLVYFDPFAQNSYNSLIIGETGSGKSYFTKLLLLRALRLGIVRKVLIFDPLNEYFCSQFGEECTEINLENFITSAPVAGDRCDLHDYAIRIIKAHPDELDDDSRIEAFLQTLDTLMMSNKGEPSAIVIDECHIILRNYGNSEILGTMIRHSRHYNTAIINISQNTDDFITNKSGSIAFNSNRTFLFRTRNLNPAQKKALKLDGFDHEPPERLMGGKTHPYSECIVSDGMYCRKIRVLSVPDEDEIFQRT